MSTLAFFAADTIGVILYQTSNGLEGHQSRGITLGPWEIPLPIDVISDIILPREITFWVTMGQLKLYLVVRDGEIWLLVLDPALLSSATLETFPTTVKARIESLKDSITTVFHWENDKWKRIEKAKF